MESTPRHCPGFETFKHLSAFECKCPNCGHEVEIFSDEFDKPHKCKGCGQPIDFSKCTLEASGGAK
jgi:ribosomal protein S27E